MSSADGGGTGFSLMELSMISAEDRRWFIERLKEEKEREKERMEESKNDRSMPSMPSMPNMPSM
jgi:hypothetical protein